MAAWRHTAGWPHHPMLDASRHCWTTITADNMQGTTTVGNPAAWTSLITTACILQAPGYDSPHPRETEKEVERLRASILGATCQGCRYNWLHWLPSELFYQYGYEPDTGHRSSPAMACMHAGSALAGSDQIFDDHQTKLADHRQQTTIMHDTKSLVRGCEISFQQQHSTQ